MIFLKGFQKSTKKELCEIYTLEEMASVVVDLEKQLNEMKKIANEYSGRYFKLESELEVKKKSEVELPTTPIAVASMLINATIEYSTSPILRAFGAEATSSANKYSKSDLREIAKHLLIYCNNSDEEVDNTQS